MKLVLVGNNDGPLRLLRSLQNSRHWPLIVGLQKPLSPALKSQYLAYLANEDQLWEEFDDSSLAARLEPLQPDLLINCFCNFKFKQLLGLCPVLNVHLAPLPRYRGRHPLHWALINGEKQFGVTIHSMSPAYDAGDIYWQATVAVGEGLSVQELREQLLNKVEEEFADFLNHYSQGLINPKPNLDREATYITRRFPQDSCLTEWYSRDLLYRKIMALRSEANPAYFLINENPVKVNKAECLPIKFVGVSRPTVFRLLPNGIAVVCTDGRTLAMYGFTPGKYNLQINQKLQ
jgi:methionyl-tRNA formyltransferase